MHRKCKLAVGAPLVWLVLACAPAAAPAATAPFTCDASALRGAVPGAPAFEPVTANRGATVCRDTGVAAGLVPTGLPAGLIASSATAETRVVPDGSQAGAVGGVSGVALGTSGLRLTIPIPAVVSGLSPVTVPLNGFVSPLLQLTYGLGSTISVDISPAVRSLLNLSPVSADLLDVGRAQSGARAACSASRAQLWGASQVAGLTVLGQSLPTDQAVDRALTLVSGQTISPATLDLAKVVPTLPAGIGFSTLVIGPLLQQAVQAALAALPAIQIPATPAQVVLTPAQQVVAGGQLTQQALRVSITALGQSLADVVFGEARIGESAVRCSGAPSPGSGPAAGAPGAAPQAPSVTTALACSSRALTLIDVLERSDHVTLYGAADQRLVGHVVSIHFAATGRRVAHALVRPDGTFRTTAPLPPATIRRTNSARYQAWAGREHSLDLKLERRLIVDSMRWRAGRVVIRGRVKLPLAIPVAPIYIQRRVSCSREVTAQRVFPRADGSWQAVVAAPPHQQVAVYRATTEVRNNLASRRSFATFTLPREVSLG